MPPFRLHVLGLPRVTDSTGEVVVLTAGKPLAALALVAFEDSGVNRGDLAAFLWPDAPREQAQASVRQAIWTLRARLGQSVIRDRDDGSLAVDPAIVSSDLDLLDAALGASDLGTIAALWSSGPLRGLVVSTAPPWNRWASELHAAWESRVGRFLESRARDLPAGERLGWTAQALTVRPDREDTHALHVRTLLELGRLDEATRALEAALSRLEGHDANAEALRSVQAELQAALRVRDAAEAPSSFRPTFVGRGAEFSDLAQALRDAHERRARRIAILGPPGIGKTRLTQEFVAFARASRIHVVEARATPAEQTLQYGTVSVVIRQLFKLPGAAGISNASAEALRSIVPSSADNLGFRGPISPAAIGDALLDLVDAVAEDGPLVIAVDNLQWVDRDSRTMLHRTLPVLVRRPILLVETCRTREGRGSGAPTFLERDADAGLVSVLELAPLLVEDVTQIVIELAAVASEEEAARAGDILHRASRGYPLHLVELLRALRDEGVLVQSGAHWRLYVERMSTTLDVPPGLRELLLRRLAAVSQDARTVLKELADRRSRPALEALKQASRLPETRFDDATLELIRADLLTGLEGPSIDFSHDLVRDAALSARSKRRRTLGWATSAVLALAFVVLVVGQTALARSEMDPFSNVLLTLRYDSALYTFAPRAGGFWERTDSVVLPLRPDVLRPYYRTAAGVVIGQLRPSSRGPDIAALGNDGSTRVLLDGGGDDGLHDLSPDGVSLLLAVEDEEAPQYKLDLELLDLASGARRTLFEPEVRVSAAWMPSGREIVAAVMTLVGNDYVVRLRPSGSEVDRFDLPAGEARGVRPCGDSGALISMAEPRVLSRWRLLDWEEGELRSLPQSIEREPSVACTPSGEFVVVVDTEEEVLRAFATADPEDERAMPLRSSPKGAPGQVTLKWHQVVTPSTTKGIAPDSMAWGARTRLRAEVRDRGGMPAQGTVEWLALDPEILNVRADTAIGNRPGMGRAVLTVDGWLADTVFVVVTGEAVEELKLADDFQEFPGDRWEVAGEPSPALLATPDGNALSIGGDAVWNDGLESRAAFPSDQGLTAEVQFSLRLTDRDDRQSILVCLEGDTQTHGATRAQGVAGTRVCAMYPQGERQTFDSQALAMRVGGETVLGFPASGLGSGAWASLGVQLRPDGRFSAIADGREVGVYPEPIATTGEHFRLVVYGRAQDTQLLLRSATVWKGARY